MLKTMTYFEQVPLAMVKYLVGSDLPPANLGPAKPAVPKVKHVKPGAARKHSQRKVRYDFYL